MGSLLVQHQNILPAELHNVISSAVCLHSAAADEAAKDGQAGLLASDVIDQLLIKKSSKCFSIAKFEGSSIVSSSE